MGKITQKEKLKTTNKHMGKITQDKIKHGKNNPEITHRITMNFNTGPQCNSDGLCNVDDYTKPSDNELFRQERPKPYYNVSKFFKLSSDISKMSTDIYPLLTFALVTFFSYLVTFCFSDI